MISVLCVDDEPGLLKIAKIFLERDEEIRVKTATSALEGLSALGTGSIDAIVSDYQMPDMDGLEFLKRVRSLDGIPFILFTGRGREEVAIEAINNGVDFYLQKGLEPQSQFAELAHKIKHAVNKRRLESLLVKSEQKFHTFADFTHDWEYWQSENNAFVYISPSCEQITGYTAEEFNADPTLLSKIVHPDDQDKWTNHCKSETQAGTSLALEIRIVHKDGTTRWISHRCQPVIDTDGKMLGHRIGNRDITRQKQDEEKILAAYKQLASQDEFLKRQYGYLRLTDVVQKENNRFLDDIFSSIQDGISILDLDLTILKVNATMERWYFHAMPLVGKKCYEAYHSRTRPCETCPTLQTLRTGNVTMETIPRIGPDRTTTGWFDLYSYPLIDSQSGEMNGIIEYVRDITDRKVAEQKVTASEERYRRLFESSKNGILILDYETGSIVDANPFILTLLDHRLEELLGKKFSEIGLVADTADGENIFEALKKGESVRYDNPLLSRDGSSPAFEFTSNVYTVNHGRVIQCDIRDISERVRMERELQKSEAQYRTIIETANEGIWIMDEHFVTTSINPRMSDILGYTPEEMIGHLVTDFMFPEDLPVHRQRIAARIQGNPDTYEQKFRHKNGNTVMCQISATPRIDNRQEFRGSFAMFTDITARKLAEDALRESEERLRTLFENGPLGMAFSSDSLRLIKVNPAFCTILGYTEEEMSRMTFRDITHPDHIDADIAGVKKLIAGEIPVYTVEKKYVSKSGRTIWANTTVMAIRDDAGNFRYYLAFIEDITERKKTELGLLESEAKYRDLVENASTIIMQTNTQGKITYFNEFAQTFFGFSEPEILGRSLVGSILPETESITGRDFDNIIHDEIVHPEKYALHETETINKNGARSWVAWRNKPQYDDAGKISGMIRFGLDITDRRHAEEALFQANKKLNLLNSITRHDILNQLTALSGYIELSKEATQDKKLHDFINREWRAANNIRHLITFTKDYQDVGLYRPMWQNLHTIVHLLAKTVDLYPTNLVIHLNHLEIYADPLLEKVVYTLLENAVRHGGPPKTIRFSYQVADKGCLILCEDDGTGVITADKEKIFERGYGKHTGFGLFLSREILGITGFTIRETGTPGKGARFEIFVPEGAYRIVEKIPDTVPE